MYELTAIQRTQLLSDGLHALVVVVVVLCTTALAVFSTSLPNDVIGTVYGGAIGYAAGRAGNVRASVETSGRRRSTDDA